LNQTAKPKVKKPSNKLHKSIYEDADIPLLTEDEERDVIASIVQHQDYYAVKTFSDYWE
jgi:hypothetical protein